MTTLRSIHKTKNQETINVTLEGFENLQIILNKDEYYSKLWAFEVLGYNVANSENIHKESEFKYSKSESKEKALEFVKSFN